MTQVNNRKYWVRSTTYMMMEKAAQVFFGFGSVYILLRALDKEAFGQWGSIFLSIAAIIEVSRAGLMQNGIMRYLTNSDKVAYPKIVTASFVLNVIATFIITIILIVGGYIAPYIFDDFPSIRSLLWIYILTSWVLLPFFHLNYIQQANLDFRGIFWSAVIRYGSFFAFNLYYWWASFQQTPEILIWAYTGSAVLGSATSIYFSRPYLKLSRQIDWSWVRKLADYGKFVFGSNLSTMIFKKIDVLLLGALLSAAAASPQDVAVKIAMLLEVPVLAIANVVFPKATQESGNTLDKTRRKRIFEYSVASVLILILPAILVVFLIPEYLTQLITGDLDSYSITPTLLRITVLFSLIVPFAVQFGTMMDAIGKPNVNFKLTIAGSVLNVILVYFCIKQWGIVGAPLGTLVSYIIMLYFQMSILHHEIGASITGVGKSMIDLFKQTFDLIKSRLVN